MLVIAATVCALRALPARGQSDFCATATPISGTGLFNFNLAAMTDSPEGQDAVCLPSQGFSHDVWWCWTAPCSGLVKISTCGLTAVDTKIAYYVGCNCPTPPPSQPPLCCDDDAFGCSGGTSEINCEVSCGQQYLIRLACKPGTPPGPGQMLIQCNGSPCSCDNCCGAPPAFAVAAGLTGSTAVMTQQAGINMRVLDLVDISAQPATGSLVNWYAPFYTPTALQNWKQSNLGTVFGVTLDDTGNIYVAHSSVYGFGAGGADAIGTIAGGAAGAIYKIDTNTGIPSVFQVLPNNMITACTGTECWPGLGQICFSCVHKCFYVSNHEDGRIYRLDATGTILSTWKHATGLKAAYAGPDPFDTNGFAPLAPHGSTQRAQRVWAVRVSQGRLYYSTWREDSFRPDPNHQNEIWSVALTPAGEFIQGTETLELLMPGYAPGGGVYSSPVADISFKPNTCCMLLAERSMIDDTTSYAHQSRLLEYCKGVNGWTPSGITFNVGDTVGGLPDSAVGGCDYDYHTGAGIKVNVWATGDALKIFSPPATDPAIYGLGGMTYLGTNPRANGLMIDSNQNTAMGDKFQQGDVEITCPTTNPAPCQADPSGMQCINACTTPGAVCVPVEIELGSDGPYRITRCDCVTDALCHLVYNGPDLPPTCADPCPQISDPPPVCSPVTNTRPDGTTVYVCECTSQPPQCQVVQIPDPTLPGATISACAGQCPNGQPCTPVEYREYPAGSGHYEITRCDCNPPPCHPVLVEGHIECNGTCPAPDGGMCQVLRIVEPPALGGIIYKCDCACRQPPQNMVDWWPMNSLTPVKDRANLLNHGTSSGGVTVATPANSCVGQALTFNGVNGLVTVPNAVGGADINFGNQNFTLEGWVRSGNPAIFYQPICDKRSGAIPNVFGYALFFWGGNLGFQIGGGVYGNFITSGMSINDGQCHHVAAVVRRGAPNNIRLFVDGVVQSFNDFTVTGITNNAVDLLFGKEYVFLGGPPVFLNGTLDEFEFFKRALADQEIIDLYNARTKGKCCDVCYAPPVKFCANQTSVQMCFQICNYCDVAASYSWNLTGPVGGPGCNTTGPITFTPSSGSTGLIKPGGCRTVCVTVQLPTGMPIPPPIITACYQLTLNNLTTGTQQSCTNTISRSREFCYSCTPPCPIAVMVPGTTRDFGMQVTNESNPGGHVDYRWSVYYPNPSHAPDGQAVSLNGLPPGEPVIGTLSVAPGTSALVPIAVTVLENEPFQPIEIMLEADTDGDGVPDPADVIVIRTAVCGGAETGDLDQDGVATPADIARFVQALRGTPVDVYDLVLADTNCDGHANGLDVQGFVSALLMIP
ncbi:MAG: LamG-like jellyroll fold domain-containing protein [Phycisphaerae bacterium]